MEIFEAINFIHKHFRTDEASGRFVGYCGRYFESIRNRRQPISPRARDLIILKAEQLARGWPPGMPARQCAREPAVTAGLAPPIPRRDRADFGSGKSWPQRMQRHATLMQRMQRHATPMQRLKNR